MSFRSKFDDDVIDDDVTSFSALDVVEIVTSFSSYRVMASCSCLSWHCRLEPGIIVVVSSRTDLDDDVIDVTSFSALDVDERNNKKAV